MKKRVIIANWKMSLALKETEKLTNELLNGLRGKNLKNTDVILCPSFTAIKSISEIIKKNELPISLGAQNVFWQERGAYTGEISPLMLKELGVEYIIIGHSERRAYLKETDETVHQKIKIALANNFVPILCVGETFEERQMGKKDAVVIKQTSAAVERLNLADKDKFIVAYEPVWVIGSGQAVAPKEAEEMNLIIKERLIDIFGTELVEKNIKIIYGGSVDSSNIKGFLEKNIDGFLIGGASLKSQEFIKIITILSEA